MKILLVGENFRGAPLESICNNLILLGVEAEILNTHNLFKTSFVNRVLNRFLKTPHYFGKEVKGINKVVLGKALNGRFDFVLFMKPILIYPATILEVKKYSKVVCLTMDHIGYFKVNSDYFYKSLPLFDLCLFNFSGNVQKAASKFGAKNVHFFPFIADVLCHYPVDVLSTDVREKGADIVFFGTYAEGEKRVKYLERLCQEGYDVKIYGNSWDKLSLNSCLRSKKVIFPGNTPCEEMSKIINSSKIVTAFMRENIGEMVASRTFEIALCKGFMLHQRTEESEEFLIPDKEAAFFETYEEMKNKIDFYLKHPELREQISRAGYEKVLNCGRLNRDQVKKMLDILKKI